jgi:hypothetical protein
MTTPALYDTSTKVAIMSVIVQSFMALRSGSNLVMHYNRLRQMLNIGIVRAEKLGDAEVEVFRRAQQALMEADKTYDAFKVWTFSGVGLIDIAKAIEGYHDILQRSSQDQMEAAGTEAERREAVGVLTRVTTH